MHIIVCKASILEVMVFQRFFCISLRYFNQLDTTSKVMYRRHEIICTGNTAQFKLTIICLQTMQWLPRSGKFVNKLTYSSG